jgi:hypothetical protein
MTLAAAAASFTVNGFQGVLYIIAFLLFLVAAIVAWFVEPRYLWASFVALGLALGALAQLIH